MDFLRALLVLVPIWWMYAGYAWLTNNVRVTWQMRLVLIAAMAGFLVMAMAIPEVFGAGALAFGLSYLFVVVLHLGALPSRDREPLRRPFLAWRLSISAHRSRVRRRALGVAAVPRGLVPLCRGDGPAARAALHLERRPLRRTPRRHHP